MLETICGVGDPGTRRSRRVVMVVDDDQGVLEAARAELSGRNYELIIASDGDSALRFLETLMPDVLVLDLLLPNVSGPSVAARLRGNSRKPRLLICSALPQASEIAEDLSADGFLLKPFVRADLRQEIERLLPID